MEETVPQENKKSEYKNPNEDEGGIRCRLRDRGLLRKRKAEAEEKETDQWFFGVESQRKRSRTDEKGGAKRRGRPRKMDPIQEESAVAQQAPSVVVVPEPFGILSGQTSGPLTSLVSVADDPLESRPSSIPAALTSVPMFGSLQSSFPDPPDPVNKTPAPVLPLVAAPSLSGVIAKAPVPVRDSIPVPVPAISQAPVPSTALDPPQVGTLHTESEGKEVLNQVLIEDVGPEEEEGIKPSQDKSADEDFSERPLVNIPEENKIFSIPTLSSSTLPQEYLPGNSI
ncbi:uncharacterized protein hemgn [Echeneis naucrates]|uniref:uncharacterized protein hemgn n=1 Tax=Echeneis naucrates TaxID=173247 RepID=UPI001113E77C|nr:uncharacterized protein LOC115048559 [Echeneis naucrates]